MALHLNRTEQICSPQMAHLEPGDTSSMLSSRMTDIASDDEEEVPPTGKKSNRRRSTRRGSQGGSPRPGTGTSQRVEWPQTRRAFSISQRSRQGSISTSRPQSSISKTHVSSVASHAFYRPMSSQRLQAQRGGPRPGTNGNTYPLPFRNYPLSGANAAARRNSALSDHTSLQFTGVRDDSTVQRSFSKNSRVTEMTDYNTFRQSILTGYPAASIPESQTPFQQNTQDVSRHNDDDDDMQKDHKNDMGVSSPGSRSSFFFRSRFNLRPQSESRPHNSDQSFHGREKLLSTAPPPGDIKKNHLGTSNSLGRNWEYFTGNTIFCCKGRFQNTRHRPINIATGSFVIVPCILFFSFSAPWLWHNISPAIPLMFGYFSYICISSFFHASVSDPGVCL